MLTAGDERGKSQQGNNNAYCQDNMISWLNWELDGHQQQLEKTTAFLIKLRAQHPSLRPQSFANYEQATEESDRMRWFTSSGELMSDENWADTQCRTMMRLTDHLRPDGSLDSMLVIIHGAEYEITITLPKLEGITEFQLLWDSATDEPTEPRKLDPGSSLTMTSLSMALIKAI
jgi:glycogen operon protein